MNLTPSRYRALTDQDRYVHHVVPAGTIEPYQEAVTHIRAQLENGERVVAFWLELDWPADPQPQLRSVT